MTILSKRTLTGMSMGRLQGLAKQRGIKNPQRYAKRELVDAVWATYREAGVR